MSILCWWKQAHIVLVKSPVDRSCDLGQFPSSCNNICARIYSWYTYEIYEKWWFSITFCVSLPEAKILGWNILRPLEMLPSWMPMLEMLLRNPHVWWYNPPFSCFNKNLFHWYLMQIPWFLAVFFVKNHPVKDPRTSTSCVVWRTWCSPWSGASRRMRRTQDGERDRASEMLLQGWHN